jgi:hypothetical protein
MGLAGAKSISVSSFQNHMASQVQFENTRYSAPQLERAVAVCFLELHETDVVPRTNI